MHGILLINLGTPEAPTPRAIKKYLKKFLSDPRVVEAPRLLWLTLLNGIILNVRPRVVAKKYQQIWTEQGSPLAVHTRALTEKLTEIAPKHTLVEYAMCYSEPSISMAIEKLIKDGCTHISLLPLYPQYSCSTTAATFDQATKYFSNLRYIPKVNFVNHYHDHPLYINALTDSITDYWKRFGKPQKLLFSFHGTPESYASKGDPYAVQCQRTAELVAHKLQLYGHEWQVVYQSRFGRSKWLQPYCDKSLEALPSQGIKNVHIICPGFACDCLETLEEIKMENQQIFKQAGGENYQYIPALNSQKNHAELLLALTQS